jgi:hypothetical protein
VEIGQFKKRRSCVGICGKKIGEKANGPYAALKIVKIPASVEWEIMEYDGREWVAEQHQRWY